MNPTFKAGDQLRVVPYKNEKVCIGDVVVFPCDSSHSTITHRVVSVDFRGIKTRGDNNNNIDSKILQPAELIGRVVSARRDARIISVPGGRRGILYAKMLWAVKCINRIVSRLLHPTYHWLAESGVFKRIFPVWAKPRVFHFTRPNGIEMQLLIGRHIIGRRRPGSKQWHIRRPFRLFVDEANILDCKHLK